MNELKNWSEVTPGLFRYVISAGACYEIHILTWNQATDVLSADAILYLTGIWCNSNEKRSTFTREELCHGPVAACIGAAIEDDKQNNE